MFQAYRLFRKQVKRSLHLYDFTMHSFLQVRSGLLEKLKRGEISISSSIKSDYGFVRRHPVSSVIFHSVGIYSETLRSTLLIKTVSDFEVFLVSVIREISERTINPFKQDTPMEIPRGLLLSFPSIESLRKHVIEKDCRNLTSGGFEELCKYYKRNLNIDIAVSGHSLKNLREIHARRHLHVHRGGRADVMYQQNYNNSIQLNTVVQVSEPYLQDVFKTLSEVAYFIDQECERLFPVPSEDVVVGDKQTIEASDYLYYVRAHFRDYQQSASHFDLTVNIGTVEHPMELRDILVRAKIHDLQAEWIISGPKGAVGEYIGNLFRLARADYFSHFECQRLIQGKDSTS